MVNEASPPLSSSHVIIAAEHAGTPDDFVNGDEETLEFVYEREDQEIPKNVTKLIVGDKITHMKEQACHGFEHLEEVDMSASVALESIGREAFAFCTDLALVKLAPNVKTIGSAAFHDCKSLQDIDLSDIHALETIGKVAFKDCTALALVKLAPNVKTIGPGVFLDCTNLQDVDLSEIRALETIGEAAFLGCRALALVKLAPNVKTIGKGAFFICTNLQDINLSEIRALETIGEAAFAECRALAFVKLAPNVKTIGRRAFHNCTNLQDIDLSDIHALETIGDKVFEDCSALSVVQWAPNVKTIGEDSFDGCRNLQDVMIPPSHHWFVRGLPFDETHELLSMDMQGHDLKKSIRIKNLYPHATPKLSMDRLVSLYAKSPLTNAEFENTAQSDENAREDWEETKVGDLQQLEEIRKAYADSIFKLLHWYVGYGLG